jgi:4-amino-4-deoxy-L-arabinose transferase-like glycosyltransferase
VSERAALPPLAYRPVLAVSVTAFVLLVVAAMVRPYGWFIDELYYLACARRLAFGYVDHPPFSIAILAGIRAVFGDSLLAVRAVAAAAFAGNILLGAFLARELGGGRRAQWIAALALATGTGFLVIASFFSMNVFEVLAWTAMSFIAARSLRLADPRGFVVLGAALGLALENKHTAVMFAGALAFGVLATRQRALLRTPWPWIGAAIACAFLLPNVLWQSRHDWASLEFYREAQRLKNVPTSPPAAFGAQLTLVGPLAFVLAIVGGVSLLRANDWRRALGIAFAFLLVTMLFSGSSRPDRIAGAYPLAFGAGAVVVERFAESRRWVAPGALAAFVILGVALGLVGLPLLPPAALAAYAERLGAVPQIEKKGHSALPQWIADRLGWEAFAARMAEVVRSLPEEDRSRAIVFAPDYGHAGALELYGPRHGLRVVLSDHNSYWIWSRNVDAPVLVAFDLSDRFLRKVYDDVVEVGTFHCDGCMPSRNDLPIFVARSPHRSLAAAWGEWKHFE